MIVVVSGWVAPFPVAGFLWHPLNFALGMRRLGHDVWFLDDPGEWQAGWDPWRGAADPACAAGVEFLRAELGAVGMDGRWIFRHDPSGRIEGTDRDTMMSVLADAELLVNVSLTLPLRPEYLRIPHRFGIDTDPVFTQVRIARGDTETPEAHTRLFSFGRPPLPAQAHEWVATRQPCALDCWPALEPPRPTARFSTMTAWSAYNAAEWEGKVYAAKDVSIRAFIDLPRRTSATLAIALGGGDRKDEGHGLLTAHGWQLLDSATGSGSTEHYRRFIGDSIAELGFAKHGYVASRCGWFSERTVTYLACGRPAVVQDTGWTDWLPHGAGLHAFSTADEALEGIDAVRADPAGHAAAARRIAQEHFDAAVVCAEMLANGI